MNIKHIEEKVISFFKSLLLVGCLTSSFGHAEKISVASWNLFLLPPVINLFKFSPTKRGTLIGENLAENNYDVIALQEVFHKGAYEKVAKELASKYPYHTGRPHRNGRIASNGLVFFSKYPISDHNVEFYNDCAWITADCFSSKGFISITLKINEREVRFINTHVQAEDSTMARRSRLLQFEELSKWLEVNDGPSVIMGDLNIDKHGNQDQREDFSKMLDFLNVIDQNLTGYPFTIDHCLNSLKKCKEENVQKQLDYIFTKNINSSLKNYRVKRNKGVFRKSIFRKSQINDLSDHFLIRADLDL